MCDYKIYTDGSSLGNPGPGGWAALIKNMSNGNEAIISGGEPYTTNNKMELKAIIMALNEFDGCNTKPPKIHIVSDSNYCVRGISEWLDGWIKVGFKGKKNVDLWKQYIEVSDGIDVTIEWVKAHNGHLENEIVDTKAREEAEKFI